MKSKNIHCTHTDLSVRCTSEHGDVCHGSVVAVVQARVAHLHVTDVQHAVWEELLLRAVHDHQTRTSVSPLHVCLAVTRQQQEVLFGHKHSAHWHQTTYTRNRLLFLNTAELKAVNPVSQWKQHKHHEDRNCNDEYMMSSLALDLLF